MTREELIGIAAEAILRYEGHSPEKAHPAYALLAVQQATAALEAVGAWETREAAVFAAERMDGMYAVVGREPEPGTALSDLRDALAIAEKRS